MTRRALGRETAIALMVTAYSVMLGGVLGLIWPRVAPQVAVIRAVNGSEAATKALLGDDMWFALLGIVAGLVTLAVLLVAARDLGRGPGGAIGLAAGGILGSLVAARLGHRIQSPHIVSTLHAAAPHISARQVRLILGYFDFEVRAKGVLLAWSVAGLVVLALTLVLGRVRSDSSR